GVPDYLGYSKIDQLSDITRTSYTDDNYGTGLNQGIKYCYLVVAYYGDNAESYASNEACAQLKKDVPVITNVSVIETSSANGSMYIAWSKPTQLDTLQAPGPFKYIIRRSATGTQGSYIPIDSLSGLNDTIYTDHSLNTLNNKYIYIISLINNTPGNRFLVGSSQAASSVFLQLYPTDKKMKLRWNNDMPWTNYRFDIFRRDPGSLVFDSIGISTLPAYDDLNLVNGQEYCYKIRSVGKYSAGGFIEPIVNMSQITCAIPVDNIPPCPPVLHITTDCQHSVNSLSWTNPKDTCGNDIAKYYIYYSPSLAGSLTVMDSILNAEDTVYQHKPDQSIAGCYAIVAVDSVGNRSEMSNTICIDITACSTYSLPNVFTPNGDGKNDYLVPFPYTSVEKIDLSVFDRWGKKVFETHEPDIRWDGKDMTTGQPCSDGVYYYICDVYEVTLAGNIKRNLHGSVTILH
ncbi:MAG: gliding motility-associated C-terminal domain-containing protein, partial [Bacteroidota bacterium]|nr:gliding motility-associated C-terminal domain-containing protein [Bacteroidota bacterium]